MRCSDVVVESTRAQSTERIPAQGKAALSRGLFILHGKSTCNVCLVLADYVNVVQHVIPTPA